MFYDSTQLHDQRPLGMVPHMRMVLGLVGLTFALSACGGTEAKNAAAAAAGSSGQGGNQANTAGSSSAGASAAGAGAAGTGTAGAGAAGAGAAGTGTAGTGTAGTGTAGAAGSSAAALPQETPINELGEADLLAFCGWATAKAEDYEAKWSKERLCTFVAANATFQDEPASVEEAQLACVEKRDPCIADAKALVVLPCGVLPTCTGTVAHVVAYYAMTDEFYARITTCDALTLDALDGVDLGITPVLPNCTLIGQPK